MIRLVMYLLTTLSLPASATLEYGGSVGTTHWAVTGSVFECRFAQDIPGYGQAVFYHQAGKEVQFRLEALRNLMAYSKAQISILPPPWRPAVSSERLGTSRLVKESPNLTLDTRRTNKFLHALLEGKWPAISHYTHYDEQRFVRVHVSAVEFDRYYQDYVACVKQLLPVNFAQVARSKVFFASNEQAIDARDMKTLDRIIFYIRHDPRVFAVYLDGHSDAVGRRYDNRQISKNRVEDVERYLIKQGIDPDIITTRFHGDRYPVASNKSARGRAENRRVTIRLEQRQDMPIPGHLIFRPASPQLDTADSGTSKP